MWYTHNVRYILLAVLLLSAPAWAHDVFVVDQTHMPKILRAAGEKDGRPLYIQGSGAVVAPGLIITARHVVGDGSAEVFVRLPNGQHRRTEIACVGESDVAFIKTDIPEFAHDHALPLNAAQVREGEPLLIVGYPSGRWTIMESEPVLVQHNVRLSTGQVIPEVVWIRQNLGDNRYQGFSGSGVFDKSGALRGFVCCVGTHSAVVGMVPLRYALAACPF